MYRRELLKKGAAVTAGVGALSVSGCSQIPFVGSGGSYTKWLHEPGAVTDTDHYSARAFNPQPVFNNEDVFEESYIETLENWDDRLDPTGLNVDELNQVVSTNVANVYGGGFSQNDVVEELEDADFDDDDQINGYTIYERNDENQAWTVGSNTLVQTWSSDGETAVDVAETVVEVGSGGEARYVDEVEAMGVLSSNLSNGFQQYVNTYEETDEDDPEAGQFENSIGTGLTAGLNGETVNFDVVIAYEDRDDVDTDDLEDWIDEQEDNLLEDLDDVSYNQSGRAGVVSGAMDADEVTYL
jgi:hypothetical protein